MKRYVLYIVLMTVFAIGTHLEASPTIWKISEIKWTESSGRFWVSMTSADEGTIIGLTVPQMATVMKHYDRKRHDFWGNLLDPAKPEIDAPKDLVGEILDREIEGMGEVWNALTIQRQDLVNTAPAILEVTAVALAQMRRPEYTGFTNEQISDAFRSVFKDTTSKVKFLLWLQKRILLYSNERVKFLPADKEQFDGGYRSGVFWKLVGSDGRVQLVNINDSVSPVIFDRGRTR